MAPRPREARTPRWRPSTGTLQRSDAMTRARAARDENTRNATGRRRREREPSLRALRGIYALRADPAPALRSRGARLLPSGRLLAPRPEPTRHLSRGHAYSCHPERSEGSAHPTRAFAGSLLGERGGEVLVDDEPLSAAVLPDHGVPAVELEGLALLHVRRQVHRASRPGDLSVARDLQIIVDVELERGRSVEEELLGSLAVSGPPVVLQRSGVVEDEAGVVRVEGGSVLGLETLPRGVHLRVQGLEVRFRGLRLGRRGGDRRKNSRKEDDGKDQTADKLFHVGCPPLGRAF